jgi:SAM-dependent methyltransferase
MTWVMAALILILVADALRMRGRLGSLVATPASGEPAPPDLRIVCAPGVTVDDATRRAAAAWARDQGLDVVDLVPRDLPAIRAMSLAQISDLARYRRDRLAPGRTAGHAILIGAAVAERAGLGAGDPADEVAFVRLAEKLRRYASGRADFAVAPGTHAAAQDLGRRKAVLRAIMGSATPLALALQPLFWLVMGLGIWLAPIPGLIALGVWHLQPLIAIAGTAVRSRDLIPATLLRAPIELWTLARTLAGTWAPPDDGPDPVEVRRDAYARLAGDADRFWEPRRDDCPLCGATDLAIHLRTTDIIQFKPGRFTLERCRGCGHIFQNPRLSLAGLDYYYKDFYDGLGEVGMEAMFGAGAAGYHARARMVKGAATPSRWLDVGAGHGHFCCAAKDELPDTRFDGLDLSESIDEARRRGWIETAYRGLFPELAPTIAGAYDAVSMSHYLEHTLDPRQELAAARTALAPGGHLLIELPDPEFGLGKVLGRYWLPWFQPQHQHLLSTGNLERLLREHGFTPLAWDRGSAHQSIDFLAAVWMWLGRLAPPTRMPWRRPSAAGRAWRAVVWTLGTPLIVVGWLADKAATPFIRRGRRSNTYRVLARLDGASGGKMAAGGD